MKNDFVPYLCGGILFSLLIELHRNTAEGFHNIEGTSKHAILQREIMEKLIRTIIPDYTYNVNANRLTFQKTVSEYRTCKSDGGKIIPFERDSTKTEFDKSVKKQYKEVLKRMTEFTSICFPTCTDTAMRALIKGTLILIRDDSSIQNNTPFYINKDGFPISKENLLKKENFCFQSFLVGTWHYIITQPTKNKNGIQTFEKLFSKCDGKSFQPNMDYLSSYENDINVTKITMSSSEKGVECEDITVMNGADKEDPSETKTYYTGGLLQTEDKEAILSNSPAIIDLNENPNISIKELPNSTIYRVTTEFQFKTYFFSPLEENVRLYCHIGSLYISGTTSIEKWISKSKLNEMRFRKNYTCTAWFNLNPCGEEYSADFLLIGRIIK